MSKRPYTMLIMVSAALFGASNVVGNDFEIDWWTVDGGGDMWTTGGDFELSGTIGQPDAATAVMTGGDFELTGGFWPGVTLGPAVCYGDLNCDGQIDFKDINPFVLYLSNFTGWQNQYPGCNPENGDMNGDGVYGQGSFGDINPFVALLSSQPLPIPCP
jgi:hypothetical protein